MCVIRVTSTEIQSQHLGSDQGVAFLPITLFQVSLILPTWALKWPSRTMESPVGAPSSTPHRDSKKAGYSTLVLGWGPLCP